MVLQVREVERLAEPLPRRLRVRTDRHVAVLRQNRLVGRLRLVRGSVGPAHDPCAEVAARLPHRQRHGGLEEGHVQVLPPAGILPLVQRGHDAQRHVERRREVGDRHAHLRRRLVREPGDAHEAGPRLRHDVESGQR